MDAPMTIEILDRLATHLAGDLSLGALKEWSVSASWRVGPEQSDALELIAQIELAPAERSSAHASDDDTRDALLNVFGNVRLAAAAPVQGALRAT